jgi:uncharacterized iron-regulated protein
MLYVQLAELSTVHDSADVEELRQALDMEREKVQALERDLEAARERDSRYAATVTEEIEKGEWTLKQAIIFFL